MGGIEFGRNLVIGAGLIGSSVAMHLARLGMSDVRVDRLRSRRLALELRAQCGRRARDLGAADQYRDVQAHDRLLRDASPRTSAIAPAVISGCTRPRSLSTRSRRGSSRSRWAGRSKPGTWRSSGARAVHRQDRRDRGRAFLAPRRSGQSKPGQESLSRRGARAGRGFRRSHPVCEAAEYSRANRKLAGRADARERFENVMSHWIEARRAVGWNPEVTDRAQVEYSRRARHQLRGALGSLCRRDSGLHVSLASGAATGLASSTAATWISRRTG